MLYASYPIPETPITLNHHQSINFTCFQLREMSICSSQELIPFTKSDCSLGSVGVRFHTSSSSSGISIVAYQLISNILHLSMSSLKTFSNFWRYSVSCL